MRPFAPCFAEVACWPTGIVFETLRSSPIQNSKNAEAAATHLRCVMLVLLPTQYFSNDKAMSITVTPEDILYSSYYVPDL